MTVRSGPMRPASDCEPPAWLYMRPMSEIAGATSVGTIEAIVGPEPVDGDRSADSQVPVAESAS